MSQLCSITYVVERLTGHATIKGAGAHTGAVLAERDVAS
jgi:hypothetical protein